MSLPMQVKNSGGRNNTGRVTTRGRGGGVKHVLRTVDFARNGLAGLSGVVQRIELDPNRTGFLALTRYDIGMGGVESQALMVRAS